jgi:hypothetical protein
MAGQNTDAIVSNMLGQIASTDPEPISGAIAATASKIFAIFGAAHAAAVKREAQTLSNAVPQWRSLLTSTVDAYNTGQIDAAAASGLIDQAVQIYYQQVGPIEHGKPQPGGAPNYYAMRSPKAPINPCNGACYVAYWYVEPEARLVQQAFATGQPTNIDLQPITIANTGGQGGVPEQQIRVERSVAIAALSSIPGVPNIVKKNPLIFGALAVLALLVVLGGRK